MQAKGHLCMCKPVSKGVLAWLNLLTIAIQGIIALAQPYQLAFRVLRHLGDVVP